MKVQKGNSNVFVSGASYRVSSVQWRNSCFEAPIRECVSGSGNYSLLENVLVCEVTLQTCQLRIAIELSVILTKDFVVCPSVSRQMLAQKLDYVTSALFLIVCILAIIPSLSTILFVLLMKSQIIPQKNPVVFEHGTNSELRDVKNCVWIRKINQMSLFVFFISLLIVAQHVSGNHVHIIRS